MDLHLTKKDFRIDWFSGTGGGGQNRNKHQNCCRITHIESGLTATAQTERDRPANQKRAFKALVSRLLAYYAAPAEQRRDFSNVVRTYHFERDSVSDGVITKPTKPVMDGQIDDFIENGLHGVRPLRETGRM